MDETEQGPPPPGPAGAVHLDSGTLEAVVDTLLRRAPLGMAYLDADLRYVLANDAVARMNGVPVERHLGRTPAEIVGPELAAQAEPLLRRVLDAGEPVTIEQHTELPARPGRIHHFVSDYLPVSAADGTIVGVLALITETTAQVEADHQAKALQAELEQARRLETIGQLAGGVAHDFNNLLAVIALRSELLRRRHPEMADVTDNLLIVEQAVGQGRELAQRLLTFSRRQPVVPELLAIDEAITRLDPLLDAFTDGGWDVTFEGGAAGADVLIDPGALEQVVFNLVLNARDAMPHGGEIRLRTRRVDDDGSRAVELTVTDTGTGMTDDVVEKAFHPFFTTKASGLGTGLGLPTVYGLVTGAGGTVRFETEPGRGTTVRVTLPVAGAGAVSAAHRVASAREAAGDGRVVLVVDDELQITHVVRDTLEASGYQVLVATSGGSALSIVGDRVDDLDLVVTDVVMPGGTGPELVRALREQRPRLPVVFMSGFAGRPAGPEALPDDTTLLRKPFTIDDLLGAVTGALDRATTDADDSP